MLPLITHVGICDSINTAYSVKARLPCKLFQGFHSSIDRLIDWGASMSTPKQNRPYAAGNGVVAEDDFELVNFSTSRAYTPDGWSKAKVAPVLTEKQLKFRSEDRMVPTSQMRRRPASSFFIVLAIFFTLVLGGNENIPSVRVFSPDFLASRQVSDPTNGSVLEIFQVYPPVLTPSNATCKQTLMAHTFAYSYGQPYVGTYTRPTCDFNRVTFNLTVTSAGRQYDRLGIVYFNDTEIFRTSTAEPRAAGIRWEYHKDMSHLLSLFKQEQKLIFDEGNLVNDIYTGLFNTTLTATFWKDDDTQAAADLIIPVSARRSADNGASVFTVPSESANNTLTLPRNIKRAVFSVAGNGQSTEEFWWSNVPSTETATFAEYGTTLYGYTPWRELQLYIDDQLAGVVWPFPVIFTGGIVPGFWRPIVGIDAFDLKEDEIDITPFLPLLCDGAPHTFEIHVVGVEDDGNNQGTVSTTIGSYWLVSGKIFIWYDTAGSITGGTTPQIQALAPAISLTSTIGKNSTGSNETLDYSIEVSREFSVSSTVQTSKGSQKVTWKQSLKFTNTGHLDSEGNSQLSDQVTSGQDVSSLGYSRSIKYPLWANQSYVPTPGSTSFGINGALDWGKQVTILGTSIYPTGLQNAELIQEANAKSLGASRSYAGTTLNTRQNGTAVYTSLAGEPTSVSYGSTEQTLDFAGLEAGSGSTSAELYHRHVLAVNFTIVEDEVVLVGAPVPSAPQKPEAIASHDDFAPSTVQELMGQDRGGN